MKKSLLSIVSISSCAWLMLVNSATAQGTAFTYQGRLSEGANPATGSYDFTFTIYGGFTGGSPVAGPLTNSALAVSNGAFTVILDFGNSPFSFGVQRWLEVAARTNGAGSFTTLVPRQKFTATPYAITASNVTGALPVSQLTGAIGNGQLANSSITVTAGAGLSGGGIVALGGSTTLNNAGVLSVTGNSDITASTVSGAVTLGDTATSADIASTIVKRDPGGNFSAATITLDYNLNLPATTAFAGIIYSGGTTLIHRFGNNNFFAGFGAGNLSMSGGHNTGIGFDALLNNTSGDGNAAVGLNGLLSNTTGSRNTTIGFDALGSNTTGNDNAANGASALVNNTVGSQNTAIGSQSLFFNTNGVNNTASGYNALHDNKSGNNNTATGATALQANRTGANNTANGLAALSINTTGGNNTALGASASGNLQSGSGNIAIGVNAGTQISTGDNNIDIGSDGFGNESGVIRIGTSGIHTKAVMLGIFGMTVGGSAPVIVNAGGLLGTVSSSARFKKNIQSMDDASDVLLALHPVTFQYKTELDPDGTPQFGLIAEDVEKVNPDLVIRDNKKQVYSVRYEAVNAMLLNEFLKQHRKVEEQNRTVKQQSSEIQELKQSVAELKKLVQSIAAKE